MSASVEHSKAFFIYLLVTAALCGALIMMIEVMGSRVVGPFFGVSLFVWTSLITVTLIALAAGYAVGGIVSDKYSAPRYLYSIILVAGIFVLLIPLVKAPILKAFVPMGLRAGAFSSTLVLFGPPLFLLGCVSPYLVRLAARELNQLGRLVGGLYALSTVGSTVGTVVTGFYLIAYLGVDNIFNIISVLLLALAAGYFVLFERKLYSLVVLVLPVLLWPSAEAAVKYGSDGTKIQTVYREMSYYGDLKVVDYSYGQRHIRELMIDGQIQGGVDMQNGLSIYDFTYHVQFLPYMVQPNGQSCLVIGLGLGIVSRWFEQQGAVCDVVDIDPAVIQVNEKFFNYRAKGESAAQDARYYLANTDQQYDYIVLDVFTGEVTPTHLLSVEALRLINNRLTQNGVLSINLMGSIKQETYMTASIIKTLRAVFDQVDIYPVFDVDDEATEGVGNLAVLGYNGAPRTPQFQNLHDFSVHPRLEQRIRRSLGRRFDFPQGTAALVLTDDYNPIDFYDGWLRENIRNRLLQITDWDLMISS